MFVNSGRAIVFMFSGMNKDVYVLGLGFSVYLFFYVYSCYRYDVAFQQFSLQCHFVASWLGEKYVQATQSLRPSSVQHQPHAKHYFFN